MFDLNNELEIKVARDILGRNAVVVDNFYKNPDEVREFALSNINSRGREAPSIPGGRIYVDTDEVKDKLKDIFHTLCFDPDIWRRDQVYDEDFFNERWDEQGFMCNVINDETLLNNPLGIIPHQDYYPCDDDTFTGIIRSRYGCVIYLNTSEECHGGTNLYSFGGDISIMERVTSGIPKLNDATPTELYNHIRSHLDNDYCRVEHSFEMVYNRMVLYEADVLHGQNAELGYFTNFDRINQVLFM